MNKTFRGLRPSLLLLSALIAAVFAFPAMASASNVIVQGTTDTLDAGLLDDVIAPGFHAAYPQYELKYISVGTGLAIANSKAGQGDALMVHAPTQEKTLVEEGYSLEPRGRSVFFSDYVIPGPLGDPAEVLAKAPHQTALAYELIAKAGAEGKANFVSRGDKSGTNTQELLIWKLTGVELNSLGEPGPKGTTTDAGWYHKAEVGQAATVVLAQQCNFTGGNCYEMTDRGTFNRLTSNGTVTELKIVSDRNDAAAPGGQNLLTNPFVIYAINPAKVPGVTLNTEGAKALLDYLTSEDFQARLASYPNTAEPAFFADAHPKLSATPDLTGTYDPGAKLKVSGNVSNLLPGAPAVAGQPVQLQQFTTVNAGETPGWVTVGLSVTGADGSYSIEAEARHSGAVRVDFPTSFTYPSLTVTPLIAVGALTQTDVPVGQVTLRTQPPVAIGRARVALKRTTKQGRLVTLSGQVNTSQHGANAKVIVQGRKLGTKKKQQFHALKKVKAGSGGSYKVSVKLTAGKWKLRVRYQDPGAALPGTSRAVSVSVR